MAVSVLWSWVYAGSLRGVRGWAIYVSSNPRRKGQRYGPILPLEPQTVRLDCEEGTWFVHAIPVNERGDEAPDWRACPARSVFAHGRDQTPADVVKPAVGFVSPLAALRVAVDPVDMETVPGAVEVSVGPSTLTHPAQGRLVGTFPVQRADLIENDPVRLPSVLIPLESFGEDTERKVWLRVLSEAGQPGTGTALTVAVPDRIGFDKDVVAEILKSDGSHSGFPAATAFADGFEYGVGYGARLIEFPIWDDHDADFDALLTTLERIGPFISNAKIQTDTVDLGAVTTFVLQIADEVHRATVRGAYDTEMAVDLFPATLSPSDVDDVRRSADSGSWQARELFMDGTPRRPIRPENARWVVWTSQIATCTTTPGDELEYVPGMVLKCRSFVCELRLREPCAMHQMQTGDVEIAVLTQTTGLPAAPSGPAGGDLAGTYPNPTLAVIVPGGAAGDATHVPAVTVDTKGRVTALGSVLISGVSPGGAAAGDLAGTYPAPTLAAIGAAAGPIGDATHIAQVTIDTKGRVTGLASVLITGVTPGGAAGGDLGGTYPNPTVTQARGLRETAGPTTLAMGAVADGQLLKRVGATVVGVSGTGLSFQPTGFSAKNANFNVVVGDAGKAFQIDSAGAVVATLPDPATLAVGWATLYHLGSGTASIRVNNAGAGEKINGATGFDLHLPEQSAMVVYTAEAGNEFRVYAISLDTGTLSALEGTDGTPGVANPFVTDSDPRNSDSRNPDGAAGGDLTGTYPNPTIANGKVDEDTLSDEVWTAIYMGV